MKEHNLSSVRLLSLDVFRGLTVAAMILVNNPGDWGNIYAPLKHARWNGCTPTDLIFPFFLFIVGVSIVFSLGSKKANNAANGLILSAIFRRGAILFGLGIFLVLFPQAFFELRQTLETVRIPGVLQRIALVYVFCAILFFKTGQKTLLVVFFLILILYWVLLTFVPVPGVGPANLEAETNLGAWLDRAIFTEAHLWNQSKTWDPEGLLSIFPALASGISGLLTGICLRKTDITAGRKVLILIITGCVLTCTGLLWGKSFPLNKALWTSSYVLFTSGLAVITLSIFYWLVEVKAYKWFTTPFAVYGVNAITVYFISTIIAKLMNFITFQQADGSVQSLKSWLYQNYFVPNFSPINASLAWAITFVLFWMLILYAMYRRKIFIKV